MKLVVTGGAGYIGSHFVKYAFKNGIDDILIIDNLSRGNIEAVHSKSEFIKADILSPKITNLLIDYAPDAVIHFASFAYVGESVANPDFYYRNNVAGSINLLQAIKNAGIGKIVFSSTCSLYGNVKNAPITEDIQPNPINPYAKSKYFIENMLRDFDAAYNIKFASLRYFNAAGCDFEGEIGESHNPEPHLIPLVLQTALGERENIRIFGNDYPTKDGTCIRDYIHVNDLAAAHLKALNFLNANNSSEIFNLGTEEGNSVREVIQTAKKITGREIPEIITPRRKGDPAVLIADSTKAKKMLNWHPKFKLNDIISSAWNWFQNRKY